MVWRRIRVKDATGGVLHPQDGGPGLSSDLKLSDTPSHGTAGIVQGELLHAELQLSAAGHNIQIITDHRLHQQCSHLLTTDPCLLYTSDAADDLLCVDLGGRRIIKKKKK